MTEYAKLKTILDNLKGKFILTCNDKEELRGLFKDYYIKGSNVHYSVSGNSDACKKYKELIITNFE